MPEAVAWSAKKIPPSRKPNTRLYGPIRRQAGQEGPGKARVDQGFSPVAISPPSLGKSGFRALDGFVALLAYSLATEQHQSAHFPSSSLVLRA